MWSLASPAQPSPIDGLAILPKEVLYFYDGPTIFTAILGLSEVLFQKFDETIHNEFFVATPTNSDKIDALREGRLSVRGAIESDEYWVIQTTGNLKIEKTWKVSEFDFPVRFLPSRHHGLLHQLNPVPDSLEQATGFFSVKYEGPTLSRQSISFRRLKAMIGEVYEVASNYLLPTMSKVSKFSVTDFDVAPLKFASLLISIKRPVVLEDAIRRRKLNIAPADGLLGQMRQHRDDLMDGMSEVVSEAQRRDLSTRFAGEHVTWISALNTLAPSHGDDVNYVEVAASDADSARMFVIDAEIAARIRGAHSEMARSRVTLRGKVVEINAAASTFVFRANNVRQTTCAWDADRFAASVAAGELVVGANVIASGNFTRRERRDFLAADSITFN